MHCIRSLARRSLFALVATGLAAGVANAQSSDLVLFQPVGKDETMLIDRNGSKVHSWPGSINLIAHLAPDMSLLRAMVTGGVQIGGATGRLQRLSHDGGVTWDVLIDGPTQYLHHDIEPMPNGNVLVIVWDLLTDADAVALGRIPGTVAPDFWPDAILELQQTGPTSASIVWEWHIVDHLIQNADPTKANYGVVGDHPELLDINFPARILSNGDWNHFNGLDYDPVNDWIMVSSRDQGEIYLIDHSTTTAEAAGHTGGARGKGGDILYRWGNPQAYHAGIEGDQQLFGQHDPRFIPPGYPGAGNVTLFNNSFMPGQSAVFEIELPLDVSGNVVMDPSGMYGPSAPTWMFTRPALFSQFVSSAQRLANGNTLICSGQQQLLLEVDQAGDLVWAHFHQPQVLVFQAQNVDRLQWESSVQ